MNKNHVITLLNKYADKFDFLIDINTNDENYKWVAVKHFQDNFDIDAEDFAAMLSKATAKTCNLINDSTQPLSGMIEYAKVEPETVRAMFKELYTDDGGNLEDRQKRINRFLTDSEELLDKYFPGSFRFVQSPRSVMAYLTLFNPAENFFYKATQACEFADCVGFYEEWGSGNNFNLSIYHKMCNEVIDIIKSCPDFIDVHKSRFEKDDRPMYADEQLHILVYDIIYSSMVYDMYAGISYEHPDSKAKKEYLQKIEKTKEIQTEIENLQAQIDELDEAVAFAMPKFTVGDEISQKMLGKGKIIELGDRYATIHFDRNGTEKKFDILLSIAWGMLTIDNDELTEYLKAHSSVIKDRDGLQRKLTDKVNQLEQYAEYL